MASRSSVGGPEFRATYPNGDGAAYVAVVYDATVTSGTPTADGDETTDVPWFLPDELAAASIGTLNRTLLRRVGLPA